MEQFENTYQKVGYKRHTPQTHKQWTHHTDKHTHTHVQAKAYFGETGALGVKCLQSRLSPGSSHMEPSEGANFPGSPPGLAPVSPRQALSSQPPAAGGRGHSMKGTGGRGRDGG